MNNQQLYTLTRSSSFLWKTSFALITLITLIGVIIGSLNPEREVSYEDLFIIPEYGDESFDEFLVPVNTQALSEIIEAELRRSNPIEDKLYTLQYLLSLGAAANAENLMPAAEALPQVPSDEYIVLSAFAHAMLDPESDDSEANLAPLLALKNQSPAPAPAPAFANYAIALYYKQLPDYDKAVAAAKSEIEHYPNTTSRTLLIDLYSYDKNYNAIRELQSDPDYAPLIDYLLQRDIALETMDWPQLIKTLLPVAYENLQIRMLLLALLTGIAWSALLLRINGTLSWKTPAVRLAIPALLLGAASAHLTILVIYLQKFQWGLDEREGLIGMAVYCIAGIGLREEFLKLLCFLPLIPFLIKRKNDLEILIVASLVGLGFAVEENINYFEASQGISTVGRFITANFLHLALTGLCGLTLTRAIIYRGAAINTAISTFGIAVLAHGAYDAFIMVPELADYSILTTIIFILITYQYFIWIRHLRPTWNNPISISAQFTLSLVLIVGAAFLSLSWELGAYDAFTLIGGEVISLGVLLILFYREIPEHVS